MGFRGKGCRVQGGLAGLASCGLRALSGKRQRVSLWGVKGLGSALII